MTFTVIPAVDLLNGQVVRLHQGRYDEVTVYAESPVDLASEWASLGVSRLHVVDLAGAKSGKPEHLEVISNMSRIHGLEVEVGGGIRSLATLEHYLDAAGARWAILGTVAHTNPGLVREACKRWPGRIIVGLDARNGRVAVNGWLEDTNITTVDLARSYADAGVSAIIYTDILRDGTGVGPNVDSTARLAKETGMRVIASGGVSTVEHIDNLQQHASAGVEGVIVGRAILSGTLPIQDTIRRYHS
jgi:phosphoribosylformimino-5-aminoimidazole carboxamide ribotide isomerase